VDNFFADDASASGNFWKSDDQMGELEELMAGVLMCDPGTLPPESTPLRDIKGWDSLKHVLLIVGLEKHLNAQLTAEEIQGDRYIS
jgi:acyl carrier protein